MRNLITLFLLSYCLSNTYGQTETEKKLILLEYQIKELKEQNQKLTERVIALEIKIKEYLPDPVLNSSTTPYTPQKNTPPNITPSDNTKNKITPKATTVKRCSAITQAGTQCKRNALEGRSRCWQH